jgi:hypothetical protein
MRTLVTCHHLAHNSLSKPDKDQRQLSGSCIGLWQVYEEIRLTHHSPFGLSSGHSRVGDRTCSQFEDMTLDQSTKEARFEQTE